MSFFSPQSPSTFSLMRRYRCFMLPPFFLKLTVFSRSSSTRIEHDGRQSLSSILKCFHISALTPAPRLSGLRMSCLPQFKGVSQRSSSRPKEGAGPHLQDDDVHELAFKCSFWSYNERAVVQDGGPSSGYNPRHWQPYRHNNWHEHLRRAARQCG